MPYQYGFVYQFVPAEHATFGWSFAVTANTAVTSSPFFTCTVSSETTPLVLSQQFDLAQLGGPGTWSTLVSFFTPPWGAPLTISCVGVLTQADTVLSFTDFSLVRYGC